MISGVRRWVHTCTYTPRSALISTSPTPLVRDNKKTTFPKSLPSFLFESRRRVKNALGSGGKNFLLPRVLSFPSLRIWGPIRHRFVVVLFIAAPLVTSAITGVLADTRHTRRRQRPMEFSPESVVPGLTDRTFIPIFRTVSFFPNY